MMPRKSDIKHNRSEQLKIDDCPDAHKQKVTGYVLDLVNAPMFAVKENLDHFNSQLQSMSSLPKTNKVRGKLETIIAILELVLKRRDLE